MNLPPDAPQAAPRLNLVQIVVYLPSGPLVLSQAQVLEWNPHLQAVSYRDDDGRVHAFHNAPIEVVFEESRIARVA